MKKVLFLLLFVLLATSSILAQDDELDNYSFETEPLKSESNPYFSVGAGYQLTFLTLNYDELNKYVADKLGLDEFSGIFTLGGVHGFTGLVVIPNTRLGFYGVSGSKISEKENSSTMERVGRGRS